MMRGDPHFDTNASIAWLAQEPALHGRFLGRDVAVSIVTVGELRYGASNSRKQAANHVRVDDFLHFAEVIEIDQPIAIRYGELKARLRAAGTPIPDNDLWIAATAIEHGLTLVSRDKHFQSVTGLACESW